MVDPSQPDGRESRDVRGVQSATAAAIAPRLVSVWVIWGSTYLGLAVLVQTLPPLLTNGIRFLIAAGILGLGLIVFRGVRTLAVTARQLRSAAMMGIALLGVGIGTVSMAERFVPSGITALLVSVMPLWIIIFRLRAGDRPSRWTLAGVAVGMTGLAAMLLPVPPPPSTVVTVMWSGGVWRSSSAVSSGRTFPGDRRASIYLVIH